MPRRPGRRRPTDRGSACSPLRSPSPGCRPSPSAMRSRAGWRRRPTPGAAHRRRRGLRRGRRRAGLHPRPGPAGERVRDAAGVGDVRDRPRAVRRGRARVLERRHLAAPRWNEAVRRVAAASDRFLAVGAASTWPSPSRSTAPTPDGPPRSRPGRSPGRGSGAISASTGSPSPRRCSPTFRPSPSAGPDTTPGSCRSAAREGAVVVDTTAFVRVLHQDHDYGHVGGAIAASEGPEAQRAAELIGSWRHAHSIAHATVVLTERRAGAGDRAPLPPRPAEADRQPPAPVHPPVATTLERLAWTMSRTGASARPRTVACGESRRP